MKRIIATVAIAAALVVGAALPAFAWGGDTQISTACGAVGGSQVVTIALSSLGANPNTPPVVVSSDFAPIAVGAVLTDGETFAGPVQDVHLVVNYPEKGGDLTHYQANADAPQSGCPIVESPTAQLRYLNCSDPRYFAVFDNSASNIPVKFRWDFVLSGGRGNGHITVTVAGGATFTTASRQLKVGTKTTVHDTPNNYELLAKAIVHGDICEG